MSKEISHIKDGNNSGKNAERLPPVKSGKIRPHNIDEVLHELQEHQAALEIKIGSSSMPGQFAKSPGPGTPIFTNRLLSAI